MTRPPDILKVSCWNRSTEKSLMCFPHLTPGKFTNCAEPKGKANGAESEEGG